MQDKTTAPLHTPRMRRLARGRWLVESHTRQGIGYPCTVDACGCKAGQFKKMCSHRRLVRQAEAWYATYEVPAAGAPVPPLPAPVPHASAVAPPGDWHDSAAYRGLAAAFE